MKLRGGGAPENKLLSRFCAVENNKARAFNKAFTLAEVLITLGIIGIVAAMTLPALVGKYQKKVTVERLKKVYTVLSQAVLMSVKDHEAIEYWNFELSPQELSLIHI